MEFDPAEPDRFAVDNLLAVIAKAAEDLRAFHDAVARSSVNPLPPFPKATAIVAVQVIDHLKAVDEGLRDILTGLGLAEPPR